MSEQPRRPKRVIRMHRLEPYLGVGRSQTEKLVNLGLLHPFSVTGMRSKVVAEEEVAELQQRGIERALAEAEAARAQATAPPPLDLQCDPAPPRRGRPRLNRSQSR